MIRVSELIREVKAIAEKRPTYRTGGTGRDGTCDCIGLIMGAMYALGRPKYDMHSTNYFARFQTLELRAISEKDLFLGQVLYRAREDKGTLNARYKAGGRYDTGDPLDYYHVGVVTGMNPTEITECTEYGDVSGIVISGKANAWKYGGKLRGVEYDMMAQEEETEMPVLYQARVITKEDPLTLRNAPISGKKIGELPKGAVVDVYGSGDWPRVRYEDMMGYAAAQYLERVEETEPDATTEEENIIRVSGEARIVDDAGNVFKPVGGWRVVFGSVD